MEGLLIQLCILALVLGLIFWVASLIPVPDPWGRVIQAVLGVIAVIYLLRLLLPYAGIR